MEEWVTVKGQLTDIRTTEFFSQEIAKYKAMQPIIQS